MTTIANEPDLQGIRDRLAVAPDAQSLHPVGLGGLVLGAGALNSVSSLVAELRTDGTDVVVLGDCREMAGAAPDVKQAIERQLQGAGLPTRRVTIGDADARVHVDAATIAGAASACAGASVLVSVGSGSVTDVGKAVSEQEGLRHVVVQTAGSVNGFSDDQSVLLVDGVKRTTATRWPDRLVIDTDVVALAPPNLNRAGLGDLLATYTAPADWLLAAFVGQDDSYSPAVVELARANVDAALESAAGIGAGESHAIERLTAALTLSGIAMGVAGRTSPASGMEHTVSHLLEMAERAPDGAAPLHGAKVGALAVLTALLWGRVRTAARAGGLERLRFPAADEMERRVHDAFADFDPSGRMWRECWSDYRKKLERWNASEPELRTIADRWAAFDMELDALLVRPRMLADALHDAGAPLRLSELGIDGARARWALTHCHLMRNRFTVADLAFLMGLWEPEDVDRLLDDAAAVGAGL